MPHTSADIRTLCPFSFLRMTLFSMAIATLFRKDRTGLSPTQILRQLRKETG